MVKGTPVRRLISLVAASALAIGTPVLLATPAGADISAPASGAVLRGNATLSATGATDATYCSITGIADTPSTTLQLINSSGTVVFSNVQSGTGAKSVSVDTHAYPNGSYTARLVFQPQRMVYRVELYHGGELWRGTETDVVKEAETTYQAFAQQTADLAQVEIDAMRLSAGKRYAEHMVQMNDQRLQGLRDDLERERQQSRQVLEQQNQTKQQAQALSSDLRSVSARLDQVQQDIRRLEKMKANPSLPLPSDTASPTPAPAAETPAAGDKP